ncbi:MAG: hypothetical protein FWC70_05545 [Defluviitaleaceae bacterium]|nr:hypothetical protein [Defluviitaleaceae bacterium]
MDEKTREIIQDVKAGLADCTTKLCGQLSAEMDVAGINVATRVLHGVVISLERICALESNRSPYV